MISQAGDFARHLHETSGIIVSSSEGCRVLFSHSYTEKVAWYGVHPTNHQTAYKILKPLGFECKTRAINGCRDK